jgi:hypothetical protein
LPGDAILMRVPISGQSIEDAATTAPNKIQFNEFGGLRTYIGFRRIGDSRQVDRVFDRSGNDTLARSD